MTIQQLLEMKLYEEVTGPFMLTVKHTHKCTKVNGGWTQELTLTDDTGDILADMEMEVYSPFVRRQEIDIILCEIQPSTKDKKLLVKEWAKVTCTADELPDRQYKPLSSPVDPISRGKVKHGLLCAAIKQGSIVLGTVKKSDAERNKYIMNQIAYLADWVMSPEDKYNG